MTERQPKPPTAPLAKQAAAWGLLALAIAVLLTVTDYTAHARTGVLVYTEPIQGSVLPDQPTLEVFVSFLLLGIAIVLLGRVLFGRLPGPGPGSLLTFASLILFVFLYNLTGIVDRSPMLLYTVLVLIWVPHMFLSGLPLERLVPFAVLAGVIGPVAEGFRSAQGHFHYVDVDAYHVPLWLSPLYFNGAVTAGLLVAWLAARLRR